LDSRENLNCDSELENSEEDIIYHTSTVLWNP
jgi:hypothetical protein